jgi:tRNA threonylcarbamoyl adenosine modification protein (Sua5/YciO/YrdC/YwlC family)
MGKVMRVDQRHPGDGCVARVSDVLAGGGVVVMPTDSVYGIGCAALPGNPGLGRIFDIKRRERTQTLPWLVADGDDLLRYGRDVPEWASRLAREFWPGALTLVVHASREVPGEYLRPGDGTIALRLPDSNLVRQVARRVGVPLATTSANTHGAPSATSGMAVESRLVELSDLTLDGGPAPIAVASTIVSCLGDAPEVLREGAIPAARIAEVAGC